MSTSLLPSVQFYLNQYGTTFCVIFGNIGNAFIIYVLKKQRRNTCSMYLIYAAIMNIIFLTFNGPLLVYTYSYGDPTVRSLVFCKIRYFFPHTIGQISRYSVAIACIDRYVITSNRVRLQFLSQPVVVRNLLIIISLVLCLFAIHIVIFTTIISGRCGQFSPYYNYYLTYLIIFTCTTPPLIMAIFGYLSYRNLKLIHIRVQPAANTIEHNHRRIAIHRRDRDLLVMILSEVLIYVITMSTYPIVLSEVAITNNINIKKSIEYLTTENFIVYIGSFLGYINNAAPFYIYVIASKAFRQQFIKCFTYSRNERAEAW